MRSKAKQLLTTHTKTFENIIERRIFIRCKAKAISCILNLGQIYEIRMISPVRNISENVVPILRIGAWNMWSSWRS